MGQCIRKSNPSKKQHDENHGCKPNTADSELCKARQTYIKRTESVVDTKECDTCYNLVTALKAERTQNNRGSAGNFVNLRGPECAQESVHKVKARFEAAARVGIIKLSFKNGTCFRVGKNKIMTALHVIENMIREGHVCRYTGCASDIFVENERHPSYCHQREVLHTLNGCFVDFSYTESYQDNTRTKFLLKPLTTRTDVPFFDKITDCIILEIVPNTVGTPMPESFRLFRENNFEQCLHIIGHPGGVQKTFDHVDKCLDPAKDSTKNYINDFKTRCRTFLAAQTSVEGLSDDDDNYIDSNDRILFNCTAMHGASGAPGVQVDDNCTVVVVTMLLCGYPNWYYDERSERLRQDWSDKFRVEQGANMVTIKNKINAKNKQLYIEIFGIE